MSQYDVVVIGAGPGGYVAAIRAAQLGLKTACVEFRGELGGTCLIEGCIPSKALLQSTEAYHQAQHKMVDLGVTVKGVDFDLKKMMERKATIVGQLTKGIEGLFKKNKIDYLKGRGSFKSATEIVVTDNDGKATTISAKNTIIATGSRAIEIPGAKFDEQDVLSNRGAIALDKVPQHLVVIGGGVIGLELGSVWSRLGAKVTIIEAADNVLAMMDGDVIRMMKKMLKKADIEVHTKTFFKSYKSKGKGKGLEVTCDQGGAAITIDCDKLLVAVGRRAYTEGLGLENVGITTDDRGRVSIDEHFRTTVPNIYAVGDVVRGPMLAHKAEHEGLACAEIIANKPGHVNYEAIPNVVYTWPEIASIGLSAEECKAKGLKVRSGKSLFIANGRAKCAGETDGFVKIIADEKTDRMVGAHIVGPNASELIAELAIAFEYHASSEDVARSIHAHPTMAEVIKEAALAVDKRSISG